MSDHLGWRVEVVRHPPHPRGEWVPHGDLARIETVWFSWQRLPPGPKVFRGVLPRRRVVERKRHTADNEPRGARQPCNPSGMLRRSRCFGSDAPMRGETQRPALTRYRDRLMLLGTM